MKELRRHSVRGFGTVPLLLAALLAVGIAARRQGVPVIDPAPKPVEADGTINGTVRGPEGARPVDGRTVEVVNVETNARERTATTSAGGFSFKLRPGRYRVELQLRVGEALVKQPGIIDLNRSDLDAHADFVIGAPRILRPRHHLPRGDDGLGSAIA